MKPRSTFLATSLNLLIVYRDLDTQYRWESRELYSQAEKVWHVYPVLRNNTRCAASNSGRGTNGCRMIDEQCRERLPYERLLEDAMSGDRMLFTRRCCARELSCLSPISARQLWTERSRRAHCKIWRLAELHNSPFHASSCLMKPVSQELARNLMIKKNQQTVFKSNPALDQLAPLIGEWNIEITSMSFDADPSAIIRGHSSFAWLEGGAFLIQHSEIPNSDFPSSIAVMGPDDEAETYRMLYYDSRGVSRIYRMTFSGGIWTLWRDFPGFHQRFHGMFSEDGKIITARWERSSDGSNWERDFDLTYIKVR